MKRINQNQNISTKRRKIFGNRIEDQNTIYNGEYEEVRGDKKLIGKKSNTTLLKIAVGAFALGTLYMGIKDCYNNYFKPKGQIATPTAVVSTYSPTKTLDSIMTKTSTRTATKTATYNPTSKPTATLNPTPVPTSQDSVEVILYGNKNYNGKPLRATKIGKGISLYDLEKVRDKPSGEKRDFDNIISSIQINDNNYFVELYTESGYRGEKFTIYENTSELPEKINNKASSCKILPKNFHSTPIPTSKPIQTYSQGKGKLKVNGLEYEVTFPEDSYGINFTRGNYTYSPAILNKGSSIGTKYSAIKTDFGDRWEATYIAPNGLVENTFIKYDSTNGLSFPTITTPNGEQYIVFKAPKEILKNKNVWFDYQTKAKGQAIEEKIENKEMRDFMICPVNFKLSEYSSNNKSYILTDPDNSDDNTFRMPVARESLK